MMQPTHPADQPPQLGFENCFVRGDGDLLACQLSRPFALDAANTLAALRGSFLSVDAGPGASAAPAGQMTLTLKKVTTYLTGNLIHLRVGKDYLNLPPVRCAPTDCLFVAAARDAQPLIHLDDSDLDDQTVRGKVLWGDGRSVYGNYGVMLDQTPPNEEMPQMSAVGPAQWTSGWDRNMVKPIKPFHFGPALPPSPDGQFAQATPQQFRPLDPTDCGADVEKLSGLLPPAEPLAPK